MEPNNTHILGVIKFVIPILQLLQIKLSPKKTHVALTNLQWKKYAKTKLEIGPPQV